MRVFSLVADLLVRLIVFINWIKFIFVRFDRLKESRCFEGNSEDWWGGDSEQFCLSRGVG